MYISIHNRNALLKFLLKLLISNPSLELNHHTKKNQIGLLRPQNMSGERKQIIFQKGICRFWKELFIYWSFSGKTTPTKINKVSYERHREAEATVQPQMV